MLNIIANSFSEVFAKDMRKTFWQTFILAIICYAALFTGIAYFFHHTTFFATPWLENAIDILGGVLSAVISLFLLPALISIFSELFSDRIIDHTEATYFPKAPAPTPVSLSTGILYSLKFSGKAAFYTLGMFIAFILILPFYFIPVLNFLLVIISSTIMYLINGYLIGKGYFDTVAMRHMSPEEASALWSRHRFRLLFAGVIIAFVFTVPVLNLLAPIFSFCLMTQMFWKVKGLKD
ncbi:MAG: EI24 domain-containing protein [Alphaproteobacteria bacterium]|nr:EI24 domain-containing protein [Alphaproteobacteria bacterium]